MITDIHSHTWPFPDAFDDEFMRQASAAKAGAVVDLTIRLEDYRNTAPQGTRTVVFGGKARLSGLWVDDNYVAQYVATDPEHLRGFLSIDPTQSDWEREMRHGHEELGLCGVKLLPMYAGFGVDDERLEPLWKYVQQKSLPVLLHTGTTFIRQAPLKYTLPRLIDPVATRYPEIRFVLAHLSHPYEGECVATIRKHPNVYSDISALHYRPWQLYNSLMLVQEYGVWDKLLFGSDYPFTTVNDSIAGLQKLNTMVEGTNLPRLDDQKIEQLIHRDGFEILGIR
ncbi:Amidohydrolase [Rosistilla carotiformis]|uniref:Amidohydrolase n=1 Tax=Rosistilla carotiformis TaxID=2528017 RepID=A0A518JUT2_9BACT|nr:amidohydrolase family protein [Rosistilla carotiformis]QDV69303.1 Amidohydrolase [Rosistilla carotiformis]